MKQPAEQHVNESARTGESRGRPYWGLVALVIVLLSVIALFLLVRPEPPVGGPRPGDAFGPPAPPGPPDARGKTKSASGVVVGYKNNPHLDYNAIEVRAGQAGILTIDFRPHTAQPVMDMASLRDSVEVNYMTHPNDEVVGYEMVSIKNARTGKEGWRWCLLAFGCSFRGL